MAMIAATAAAPAASSSAAASKSGAQEEGGTGFSDLMRKMTPKDDKQEKAGEQTPAPSAGAATEAPVQPQGEAALPDLLAGLFEPPVQPDAGEGTTQSGGAASLMAALAQPDGAAALQAAPAAASAVQGQAAATPRAKAGELAGSPAQPAQPIMPEGAVRSQLEPRAQQKPQQAMPSGPVMPSSEDLEGLDDAGLISRLIRSDGTGEGEPVDDAGALRVAAGMGKMNVTREETHFAPSLRLSPAQQIGTAIASALNTPAQPDPARSDAAAAVFRVRPDAPAVKMLEIQLQPMELGTVKVTMKLTGDSVQVVMTASNPDTVELLKQDRQLLDQMMRATGHKADSITIQAAGDDRPAFQVTGAQAGQGTQGQPGGDGRGAMAQGQFGEAMGGGKEGQGGRSSSSSQMDNGNDGTEGQQHATAGDSRSGALYL